MHDIEQYKFEVEKFLFSHPYANDEFLMNSVGIYPEYVKIATKSLIELGYVININGMNLLTEKGLSSLSEYPFYQLKTINLAAVNARFSLIDKCMPHENPRLFQYWFSEQTCEEILKVSIDMINKKNPRLAFIGTPRLALYFHLAYPDLPITIIDISKPTLDYLTQHVNRQVVTINADVCHDSVPVNLCAFDAIFIDPPFYPDYYKGFLTWADALQNNGGLLFAVLFGTTVKDDNSERKTVMDEISKRYVFIKSFDDMLQYKVPQFEKQTYNDILTEDIMLSDWRKNTLGVFAKCTFDTVYDYGVDDDQWDEYVFGRKTIMVRKSNGTNNASEFVFHPLYNDTMILKSVSRKCSDRVRVDLWTSDNEVFSASESALQLLRILLNKMEKKIELEHAELEQLKEQYGAEKIRDVISVLNDLRD